MSETRVDVTIVGGGISGLAAAYHLSSRGIPFALLEASEAWGGVIRTERESGFLLDAGPDSILAQKPEGVALCRKLGLGDRLVPTNPDERIVYVLHRGRLHAMPDGMVLGVPTRLTPLAYSGLFSWHAKLRMALEPFLPVRRDGVEESIAGFLGRRLGREAVERLGEPLLGGIHAGDPERLSMQATFPRLPELEQKYGSLMLGMRAAARHARRGSAAFVSLVGGMGELTEAIVAALPAESLHTETRVTRLELDGREIVASAEGGTFRSRAVILATPPYQSAALTGPLVPDAATLLGGIVFASTATVLLGFKREDVTHSLGGYGLVVPRTERAHTLALSFVSTKLPGRAPAGCVLLRGFVGGIHAPEVLQRDDATLVQHVYDDMAAVLGLRGAPVVARVFRWPRGTPQMEVGHMGRVAAIERAVAAVPGLVLTGAGLRVTGIPDAIADGTRAAEAAEARLQGR